MHLRTARAESGRKIIKKREKTYRWPIKFKFDCDGKVQVEEKKLIGCTNKADSLAARRVAESRCQHELHAVIAFLPVLFRVPFTNFYRQLACVHES